MFTAEFNIVCKLKVHESGYEIVDGKIRPIHTNSNTTEKIFSNKTYTEFMDLNNHRIDQVDFEERLIVFTDRWGMLSDDIYVQEVLALLGSYLMIKDDFKKMKKPTSKLNILKPTAKLSYQFRNKKILPTFEVKTIAEAIELTFFLTSELEQVEYVTCNYYKNYGPRNGCMKRFPYRPNKKHCSRECKEAVKNEKKRAKKSQTNTYERR